MKQFNENWDGISRKNANINEASASDAYAARFRHFSRTVDAANRQVAAQKIALDKAKATLVAATKTVADLTASHAKAIQAYNTAVIENEENRVYSSKLPF